jgi:Family of unknown function (DUF6412)
VQPEWGCLGYLAEAMMVAWLVGAVTQLAGYWLPAGHVATIPSASGLMAVAAVALTGMLVALLAHGARIAAAVTARPLVRGVTLRVKSWSAAFQRQLDPDAAGRSRPRAPSAAPAVA